MEVIVRNLDFQLTKAQTEKLFRPKLAVFGINTFHCQKLSGKGNATITVLDPMKCQRFLYTHGQTIPGNRGFQAVKIKLFSHSQRPLYVMVSNHAPDKWVIFAIQNEESQRYAALNRKALIVPGKIEPRQKQASQRAFEIAQLKCGQLTYKGRNLMFSAHYSDTRSGRIIFASRVLLIKLTPGHPRQSAYHVHIPYDSIEAFMVGSNCITLSLLYAPKLYEVLNTALDRSMEDRLRSLTVNDSTLQTFRRKRRSALDEMHDKVIGNCFHYRLTLAKPSDSRMVQALNKFSEIPKLAIWNVPIQPDIPFPAQMSKLNEVLARNEQETKLPFEVKFQLQRMAQNGILPPLKVVDLIPYVRGFLQLVKAPTIASALRHLANRIPVAGPDAEEEDFTLITLAESLQTSISAILEDDPYYLQLAEEYDHIAMIHKISITPAGTYLHGPEPEIKNRVLRKYSAYLDHFISVSFEDENGHQLRFERDVSSEDVYWRRFISVLNGVISVAGRPYEFLGFSHSSLREQACWFMAPFTMDNVLLHARAVIKGLGDFSLIRSPAKCAARIGQAFSQTLSSISISPDAIFQIPDVERNGRTFSDGVGTCSAEVLNKIWEGYKEARGLKPTVLQIRFQGAKGVISLDMRLRGEKICLRPSMIKFPGSPDMDIEICGAANKPLPMYLNRQLIKILEDLGVPAQSFLHLQASAVEDLRSTTISPINASTFFQRNRIGTAAKLPWLIKKLHYIGFDFADDDFLRDTLEMGVLIQLREIKHRSRILVKEGWTLYGIMDETGFLKENQIYCTVHTDRGLQGLTGDMIITRCPALHPGDVQCVQAVDVPEASPLRALHNMVVFSSHGARDLPSKLSGGDLDGDLYNIMWDPELYPKISAEPAEYEAPKLEELDDPVERGHMTNHFVTFMENDTLGMIATLHQILADQSETGTLNPICIHLAELHSAAVDFSKTGIPVSRLALPRWPKARPDFQAPGPRVLVEKGLSFEEVGWTEPIEESDEVDEANSYGPPRLIYYESKKVLGQLYRAIDEHNFFRQIQKSSGQGTSPNHTLIDRVWEHVSQKALLIEWKHCLEEASNIKENYEDNLADTMIQFASHHSHPVSEVEVFSGSILGRDSSQSKQQRENSTTMKDKFDRDVTYITKWITHGDHEHGSLEALERSLACLWVGIKGRPSDTASKIRKKVGELVSFKWIAAAVCLREVEKMARGGGQGAGDVEKMMEMLAL